jgi:short-subunit dehydrogenase
MTETLSRPEVRQDATSLAREHGVTPTVAVVTGASSGIGRELARLLARDGWTVVAVAEDDAIRDAGQDAGVEAVQLDLTDDGAVSLLWERATAGGTRDVDLVVLNAGVGAGGRKFIDIPLQEDLDLVALNVVSTLALAKRAAVEMAARRTGRLLFTSSLAATMPAPYQASYGASKAFVQSLAQALHKELAEEGVIVTALLPGPTETNFFRRAGMQTTTRMGRAPKDDPATVAQQGYTAVLSGDDRVVGGNPLNKVQEVASRVLPDRVRASVQAFLARPRPPKS